MNDHQSPGMPSNAPAFPPGGDKRGRFWQCFWLTFLVVSLGAAWYCFYAPSNRIAWADDFATAQQTAVESDKPMILYFTGAWCSPCRIMKRQVWADDQVMKTVNQSFIPVMIDVGDASNASLLSLYGVGGPPSTIITDSKGNVLQRRYGGISKAEFLELLAQLDASTLD